MSSNQLLSSRKLPDDHPALLAKHKWQRRGVYCVLDKDKEIGIYAISKVTKEQIPVPSEALNELGRHYDAILEDLQWWDRIINPPERKIQ